MPYNTSTQLWPDTSETFFRDRQIRPIEQEGPHCVSTVLAMLSGTQPERFQGLINTQDPSSWSAALLEYGLKLAYCPTDLRKMRFYLSELEALNDLFTVSYYTPSDPESIFKDPREKDGWVCGSHIVIMQGHEVIDPALGGRVGASIHRCMDRFTKRIFRVVPAGHHRGL
jgi:hypothetical protein